MSELADRPPGGMFPAALKEGTMAEAKLAPNLPDWMVDGSEERQIFPPLPDVTRVSSLIAVKITPPILLITSRVY